ncbi:S8 family peptidase [Liquorilactobacillus hordei]|uniref:S8 family peptidase n=1 Tax=Liquorilactobacillus hordei TaxID=468911 RepID=UPI0039ED18C0
MDQEKKPHFWISDEEVIEVPKKLTSRTKEIDIVYSEHGPKLSASLKNIEEEVRNKNDSNSLDDSETLVFKVDVAEGNKIQYKDDDFSSLGLTINAVKSERTAIVTTTKQKFKMLKDRVQKYTENGSRKTKFDYIEDFSSYLGTQKNASDLNKKIYLGETPPVKIDVQFMFIPKLVKTDKDIALKNMVAKIKRDNGELQDKPYSLSDDTLVVRAVIPSSSLSNYENDSAIYRIEETRFFEVNLNLSVQTEHEKVTISNQTNLDLLPIVTVLDSGITFPSNLSPLILDTWQPHDFKGKDFSHGTKVASKVIFRHFKEKTSESNYSPRARVIDCRILDGSVPENVMIRRIQEAVGKYSDVSKIYNLSANTSAPIEADEMSIIGYEIDAIQLKKDVQFVLSAGNHNLWQTETNISDIIDDDDSIISSPADSMLGITVGAICAEEHSTSLSGKNMIAPYSRKGPGFSGFSKPDVSAYSGTIIYRGNTPITPFDEYSLVMNSGGQLLPDSGTSFAAPIVSGDLAEISQIVPDNDLLISKALLYHNAKVLWDEDDIDEDELSLAHNLYGRGLSTVDDSKFSSPSKVTFVRRGFLNREKKERVKIYMPELLAAQPGRNAAKVTVTCLSKPPVDRTKGTEYLGAYVRASLKKSQENGTLAPVQPATKESRKKWDVCHQFSKMFSRFNAGDWQIWLELFGRWEDGNDNIPYALIVTIEDMSGNLDIYNEVQNQNRYQALNQVRVRAQNK